MQQARSLSRLAIGSLCAAAVAASPGLAAPGITLEGSFTTSSGSIPFAALTPAGGELYYGTTVSDASKNFGGVYQFKSTTGAITLLDRFDSNNGSVPFAALTAAGGSLYYGTTTSGGAHDLGAVFAFDSSTGAITLADSFTGLNGANPYAALTPAGGGLYYGTTYSGGSHDLGVVFAFNSTTRGITLKESFNGSNGANSLAPLTEGQGGLYYGTTGHGGASDLGGVFVFDSTTGTLTLLDSFSGPDGAIPHAGLTAAGGNLYYGTTRFGGANGVGAVFAFNSVSGAITLADSFNGANGDSPFAALTPAAGDLFYGTTYAGGAHNLGTVFEFNSRTGAISLKDSFNGSNGAYPLAGLTAGDGGVYYGTTILGGAENIGAIYSFNPVPGPLPVLGAGAALGWSRRLRRRVTARRCPGGHATWQPKTWR